MMMMMEVAVFYGNPKKLLAIVGTFFRMARDFDSWFSSFLGGT
jgi:hypothetical protein